jgi:predicted membrane protein
MNIFPNISKKQETETAIVFAVISILIGICYSSTFWYWVACLILLLALLLPSAFKPLAYCWFGLSKLLGRVMSGIILTFLFYLLVTPVGLIRKWMGKDTLNLKSFKKNRPSAFVIRNQEFTGNDLTYPF